MSNVLRLKPAPRSLPSPPEEFGRARVEIANARKPSAVRSGVGGFLLTLAAIAVGVVLALATYAAAQPADPAPAAAPAAAAPPPAPAPAEAGSGVGTTTPAPHEGIADPTKAPAEYIDDVRAAKRQGWPLAILVGVYGVLIALIRLGWVKKVNGTAAAVVAGAASVIAAVIDALVLGGTMWGAAFAGLGAVLLLLTPQKTAAAKAEG